MGWTLKAHWCFRMVWCSILQLASESFCETANDAQLPTSSLLRDDSESSGLLLRNLI